MTEGNDATVAALSHGDIGELLSVYRDAADQTEQLAVIAAASEGTATIDWYRFGATVYEVRKVTHSCPIHGQEDQTELECLQADTPEHAAEGLLNRLLLFRDAVPSDMRIISDSLDPELINPYVSGPGYSV